MKQLLWQRLPTVFLSHRSHSLESCSICIPIVGSFSSSLHISGPVADWVPQKQTLRLSCKTFFREYPQQLGGGEGMEVELGCERRRVAAQTQHSPAPQSPEVGRTPGSHPEVGQTAGLDCDHWMAWSADHSPLDAGCSGTRS